MVRASSSSFSFCLNFSISLRFSSICLMSSCWYSNFLRCLSSCSCLFRSAILSELNKTSGNSVWSVIDAFLVIVDPNVLVESSLVASFDDSEFLLWWSLILRFSVVPGGWPYMRKKEIETIIKVYFIESTTLTWKKNFVGNQSSSG